MNMTLHLVRKMCRMNLILKSVMLAGFPVLVFADFWCCVNQVSLQSEKYMINVFSNQH